MKLKKYIDFINENKDSNIDAKYINNKDRNFLVDFLEIINAKCIYDLPEDLKKNGGHLSDKKASYILSQVDNEVFSKYIFNVWPDKKETIYENISGKVNDFNNRNMTSENMVENVMITIDNMLTNNNIMHNGKIIMLTDEEEKALPSIKTIDKYSL